MGNTVASTVRLSDLLKSQEKCAVSPAADIMMRLNIEIPGEFTNKQHEDGKENDNDSSDALLEYLRAHLDGLSDDQLNQLFLRFGVIPDLDSNSQTAMMDKKEALMLIASNDYWRKNWSKHPLMKRVKNWLFVHEVCSPLLNLSVDS